MCWWLCGSGCGHGDECGGRCDVGSGCGVSYDGGICTAPRWWSVGAAVAIVVECWGSSSGDGGVLGQQ